VVASGTPQEEACHLYRRPESNSLGALKEDLAEHPMEQGQR